MKMPHTTLAAVFRRLADAIEAGDSFEGELSYTCMLDGLEPKEFEVVGAHRIGNRDGQGVWRVYAAEVKQP